MDKYLLANRALGDEWTAINYRSDFYKVDAFKAGQNRLRAYEIEEIGPVEGKTLLHLQCHFGLDTLSWARLGAQVTGADFSPAGIERARALAAVDVRRDTSLERDPFRHRIPLLELLSAGLDRVR
jgi:2-polyprenyl-3-methyl-5-hydroxy-6-metoxy-1,4-benzoquinol methylase